MAVLPKVRSALCAASQLPGEGPTDVEDAPAMHVNQNPLMMLITRGLSHDSLFLKMQNISHFTIWQEDRHIIIIKDRYM